MLDGFCTWFHNLKEQEKNFLFDDALRGIVPVGLAGKKGKRGREGGGLGLKKKESFVCFFNSNTI